MRDDELLLNERVMEAVNAVLDRIRAEIEQTADNYNPTRAAFDGGYVMAIKDVLQIIDNYTKGE